MTSNSNISAPSPSAPKEKIHTIMEAASALTALGDEDSASSHGDHTSTTGFNGGSRETAEETAPKKAGLAASSKTPPAAKKQTRYLPNHKKPDAAPTFPEKLMRMMQYAETQGDDFCVAWLDDGNSFVIRNFDEFTRSVVPLYFKATKFASFTRKLYRWGFRQVNRGIGPDDPIIFGNEHFKRDHPEEMANMKSVTAASARKAEEEMAVSPASPASSSPMFGSHNSSNTNNMMSMNHSNNNVVSGMKRSFDDVDHQQLNDNHHKRALFDHMFQQHHQKVSATMSTQQPSLYGVASQSMQPLPMNGQQYQQQQYQHQTNVRPQQQQQMMRQSPTFDYVNRNGGNMMMNNNYNVNTNNNNYNNGNNYQNINNDQQQQQYNQGGNSFMNQFVPPQQQHGGNNNNNSNMNSQYPSANSTAEIVNAAIAALRYA